MLRKLLGISLLVATTHASAFDANYYLGLRDNMLLSEAKNGIGTCFVVYDPSAEMRWSLSSNDGFVSYYSSFEVVASLKAAIRNGACESNIIEF